MILNEPAHRVDQHTSALLLNEPSNENKARIHRRGAGIEPVGLKIDPEMNAADVLRRHTMFQQFSFHRFGESYEDNALLRRPLITLDPRRIAQQPANVIT